MNVIGKTTICTVLVIIFLLFGTVTGHCEKSIDSLTAFMISFAVPGLGQYLLGSPGYAKLFFATELAIWSGYYYNNMMKHARKQDYLTYASLHAGVNPSGFGTSYLNAIGAYNSSFEHNALKQQKSAVPVTYTGEMSWNWESIEHRMRFRNLREHELDYENNIKYCIAGAVLNHFLSGLHASKLAGNEPDRNSAVTVNVIDRGLSATFTRSF